jgi:CheY-like chemotaxis protein
MTTLTLPPAPDPALLGLHDDSAVARAARPQQQRLLVLSDDEEFWQTLSAAATICGRKLIRERAAAGTRRILRLVKPAAVLLDLDLPSATAWDAADSLLQDATCPPLLLLTSRNDQADFKTAIQAGSLIDKSECPARLLELADLTMESSGSVHRKQCAMQRLVIRWLKPCNWSAQVIPLRRFWGINE